MVRLAIPAELDSTAIAGWDPHADVFELGGATMGTGWRVRFATVPGLDQAAIERHLQSLLDRLVDEMSHWEPGSVLGRFNLAAAGTWCSLPPDFATVMATALEISERSDGAFDPAIGALVDVWGFGTQPVVAPPDDAAIRVALAAGGWLRLAYEASARLLRQPGGLRLDLSGIAKGHAADRLADRLAEHGVRHALCEVGGEFVGRGLRPDGDPWWVDLETPGEVASPLRVALYQLAVATSGDYVRGRHTIDPRIGTPVSHVLAVSVIARSAMLADAWATALGVLKLPEMAAMAARENLAARALLREGDRIVEWISPALAAMLVEGP